MYSFSTHWIPLLGLRTSCEADTGHTSTNGNSRGSALTPPCASAVSGMAQMLARSSLVSPAASSSNSLSVKHQAQSGQCPLTSAWSSVQKTLAQVAQTPQMLAGSLLQSEQVAAADETCCSPVALRSTLGHVYASTSTDTAAQQPGFAPWQAALRWPTSHPVPEQTHEQAAYRDPDHDSLLAELEPELEGAIDQAKLPKLSEHAGQLSGIWQKVKRRSDTEGYKQALKLMGIGGIQRQAAMRIDGMELRQSDEQFEVYFLTVVPQFKVRERYKFDEVVQQRRRDLRRGKQRALARCQSPGDVDVTIQWGPNRAGEATERYTVQDDGCLHVDGTVTVDGQTVIMKQVYERKDKRKVDSRYFKGAE